MDCPPGQNKIGRCREVTVSRGSTVFIVTNLTVNESEPFRVSA